MIDTHCHLTFEHFRGREAEVLADAAAAGVDGAITVSTTPAQGRAGLDLARRFPNVWCTAGHHPLHADEPADWNVLGEIGSDPRCVAWGELGLDNHYDRPARPVQDALLEAQLAAIESWHTEGVVKPIVVHCREAFDDLLPVLRAAPFDPARYVFHCFTGTPDDARAVLDFGAWISFTGVVTFRNAREVADAARLVPEDRLMVETDAPFLSPEPVRTVWPNEPKHVAHVARFLAGLRGAEPEALFRVLDDNAERFFGVRAPAAEARS